MSKRKIVYSTLALPLGAFLFIFAGLDDSPGGQLIGIVVAVWGIWNLYGSK